MILERIVDKDGDIHFRSPDGSVELARMHDESDDCITFGCLIHFPSPNHMYFWPYNWREDRGIMERLCSHGVGHPDHDGARFHARMGRGYENVHGCDGCCIPEDTEPRLTFL